MGYCHDSRGRLCCDACGQPGGVRKRLCPHFVTFPTVRGRQRLRNCSPPALCPACFHREGGTVGIHGGCRAAAAKSQAEYDAIEAAWDAGESFIVSATAVADGIVAVTFRGLAGETRRLVPAADYDYQQRPRLSDYPQAAPCPSAA
jgi:hypothetical protein